MFRLLKFNVFFLSMTTLRGLIEFTFCSLVLLHVTLAAVCCLSWLLFDMLVLIWPITIYGHLVVLNHVLNLAITGFSLTSNSFIVFPQAWHPMWRHYDTNPVSSPHGVADLSWRLWRVQFHLIHLNNSILQVCISTIPFKAIWQEWRAWNSGWAI